ncbi:MAG: primosomal protein N', partial [Gammaproteobacteria bacterium]
MTYWPSVVVATPAHSGLGGPLTYRSEQPLAAGCLVRVPLGPREVLGIVWSCPAAPPPDCTEDIVRPIVAVLDGLPPLAAGWRQLVAFAARYYQRGLGEMALSALPPALRDLDNIQLARRLKRLAKSTASPTGAGASVDRPEPSAEQQSVLEALHTLDRPALLFGSTGSGKTEVYLRATEQALQDNPVAQVLVLVPEINLTPQLETRFRQRFEPLHGSPALVCLHSGMTPAQRLQAWLAAHAGSARIVLGTRMAIFASLPGLRLIVVDEEHDPSYKSQEGARYSARDLAVYRAKVESAQNRRPCRVILGSATPSLESWHAADQGRYQRLAMPARIGGGELPRLRLVDMNHQPKGATLSPPLLAAMEERIARGEQCLVLLNRRGYAPVLACDACAWKSQCPHCSAYQVFHKLDRTLRCHHCGLTRRVPRACPDCGNLDIAP